MTFNDKYFKVFYKLIRFHLYQSQLGVGTLAFWSFHLGILVGSPIYAWLYNKSGKIAFVVVLYHSLGNLSGEIFISASHIKSIGIELVIALFLTLYFWKWMRKKFLPVKKV